MCNVIFMLGTLWGSIMGCWRMILLFIWCLLARDTKASRASQEDLRRSTNHHPKSWRHSQSTPSPPPFLPDNCNSGRLGARKGPHIILGGSVRVKCTDLQTMCTYLAQTARQIEWIFGEKTGFNAEESPQRATLWRRALPDAEDRFTKILLAGRGWHPLIV